MTTEHHEQDVSIRSGSVSLPGILAMPANSTGIVVFSHGSGSGRHSPRNQYVAQRLRAAGLSTLLLDLLTVDEKQDYSTRLEIGLLTERLTDAVAFVRAYRSTASLPVGLFGASTGAASALRVAANRTAHVRAVVSRGGRADLTGTYQLARILAATLLIVGGRDLGVMEHNQDAFRLLRCVKKFAIVPEATHLFEEPGALEEVARLASNWFVRHLLLVDPEPVRRQDARQS
jgi:putative phosphoribosyl transferase